MRRNQEQTKMKVVSARRVQLGVQCFYVSSKIVCISEPIMLLNGIQAVFGRLLQPSGRDERERKVKKRIVTCIHVS